MFANIFQLGREIRRKDIGGRDGKCVSYDGMRLREIHSILIAISQNNLKYSLQQLWPSKLPDPVNVIRLCLSGL